MSHRDDQPRWPRGAPDDAEGHGQGGRFRAIGAVGSMSASELAAALQAGRRFQVDRPGKGWYHVRDVDRQGRPVIHAIGAMQSEPLEPSDRYRVMEVNSPGRPDWAQQVADQVGGDRYTRDLMSHAQVLEYVDRSDYELFRENAGGAFGVVEFREYSDGTRLVHKTLRNDDEEEVDREVETSLIARVLGVPTPAVVRVGPDTMLMEYIRPRSDATYRDFLDSLDQEDGKLIALLDVITSNADRHSRNVVLRDDGRVFGIDHGLALTEDHHSFQWRGGPVTPHLLYSATSLAGATILDSVSGRQTWFSREAIAEARRRVASLGTRLRSATLDGVDAALATLQQISSPAGAALQGGLA